MTFEDHILLQFPSQNMVSCNQSANGKGRPLSQQTSADKYPFEVNTTLVPLKESIQINATLIRTGFKSEEDREIFYKESKSNLINE